MFIVSANYRDRSSPYRWLMRRKNESPSAAKAFKEIRATEVKFVESDALERGFGCMTVAQCETAEGIGPEGKETFLEFRGYRFFEAETGKEVQGVSSLELRPNGSMVSIS